MMLLRRRSQLPLRPNRPNKTNAASAKLASDSAALSAASQAVTAASAAVDQARYAQENLLPTFSFTAEQKALTQQLAREAKAVDDQVIPLGGWLGDSAITGAPAFNEWATKMTDTTLEAYQAGDYENYLERLKPYYGDWTDQLKSDKNETVDLTNVTDAQVHELSTFTAALLNRISQELGIDNIVSKEVATQGAAAVAKEVAQISTRDNVFGGHYLRALHTAYYDHGLTNSPADEPRYQTADSNDMGESLSTYGDSEISGPKMSMAKVKENLVQSIAGMIFADGGSQMGHAISMLGLDTIDNPNNEQIIGVAPSYAGMPNSWNTNVISMHINQPYLSCFKNPTAEQKQKQDAAGMFVELPDQTANAAREELKQA
ncbi:SEC10/PgrA surface exclusion domain-containing protein [Limosilactobacillus sp.]|uniref:SEC10/PgrA surface exclusion domain-containing protein n=1 Tax=Limosilactobacillus sp. TaxID=2773925 RepID=UPI00345E8534